VIDGKFNVVFRGQIVKSMALDDVKANLLKLFKSTPQSIEKLFCGKQVTIKKNLDYAAAMKYQAVLKKAGALALIQEVESSAAPGEQAEASHSTAAASNTEQGTTNNETTEDSQQNIDGSTFTLAEVGARILPPKPVEKREVDTSGLSVAPPGERLLPPQKPEQGPQPNIDHLSLADD